MMNILLRHSLLNVATIVALMCAVGCDSFCHARSLAQRRLAANRIHSSFLCRGGGGGWKKRAPSTTTATAANPTEQSSETADQLQEPPLQRKKPALLLSKYYLIWSPTMMSKLVGSSTVLAVLHLVALNRLDFHRLVATLESSRASNVLVRAILPLLASACCALQLLINVVWTASGCAGFNTALGPWRPYLLAMLAYMSFVVVRQRPLVLVGQWMLALLPEMVHGINIYNRRRRTKSRNSSSTIPMSATGDKVVVKLNIPNMGCVACINKIDASLRQVQPLSQLAGKDNSTDKAVVAITDVQSWLRENGGLQGGMAQVVMHVAGNDVDNGRVDDAVGSLVQAVEQAGFPCTVESVVSHQPGTCP